MEYYIKNGRQVIDNNTLAALTLLIAESNPKEKPVIIDLVMNFLNNEWKYNLNLTAIRILIKNFRIAVKIGVSFIRRINYENSSYMYTN